MNNETASERAAPRERSSAFGSTRADECKHACIRRPTSEKCRSADACDRACARSLATL
jgi:hypothetical protein